MSPWLVFSLSSVVLTISLRYSLTHMCGGTILNELRILTAAHCVCMGTFNPNPAPYTIQYGSVKISETTDRSIQVSRIRCHDLYEFSLINDIAILELTTAIPRDGTWEPVKLARAFNTSNQDTGVAIGWGKLWHNGPVPGTLQKLNVDVYSDSVCGIRYNIRQFVCFGAKIGGACSGDSGSSLLSNNNEQIGVAAFMTNTCGIANKDTPIYYSRVTHFLDWIEEHSKI